MNMDLSIIMVNWNTKDLLEKCLESVLKNVKNVTYEVVIVDNNFSDDSVDLVKQRFPNFKLLVNDKNIGGLANDQALPYCHGKYILSLHPDAIVLPGSVERMINFLDNHNEAGAVSAYFLYPNGRFQRHYRSFPNMFNRTFLGRLIDKAIYHGRHYSDYYMQDIKFSKIVRVDQTGSGCIMFRKKCYRKLVE